MGTEALTRFISGDAALHDWMARRGDALHVTTISLGELLARAEAMANVTQRKRWLERLTGDVATDFGPRMHAFDLTAARELGAIRAELEVWRQVNPRGSVPEGELYILAIARAERLELVEPRLPFHAAVADLTQHDPWSSETYRS